MGRPLKIKTPEDMEQIWEAYKQDCDNQMVLSHDFSSKNSEFVSAELKRSITYTVEGFCIFVSISRQQFYSNYAEKKRFTDIVTRIREECEVDARKKFELQMIPSQLAGLWMSKYGYTTKVENNLSGGLFKFMLKVAESPKKLHILAADDTGAAEKNIINKDLGIIDDFGILTEYKGNGSGEYKMPHVLYHTSGGDKIIFVVGYGNKRKWRDALGGQYGCLYIDEINTADIEFVREAAMRSDYLMATLNPDDPGLDVYREYINCSRPLPEWQKETPKEIIDELKEEPKPGWVHWFFSFAHNLGLSKEKLDQIMINTPKGTKIWKNKILGLRGKATGLIFSNFDRKVHVVTAAWVKQQIKEGEIKIKKFTAALDTSYSSKSPDTIAMIFQAITTDRRLLILDEKVYSNKDLSQPLAPSDTTVKFIEFLERCRSEWGFAKDVFIDSADQATIMELRKYKRLNSCLYNFIDAYKKIQIIDRIKLQLGWIQQGSYLVVDTCTEHLGEMDRYSWDEKKDEPEDKNDHTINASQYGWIPYRQMIGFKEDEEK